MPLKKILKGGKGGKKKSNNVNQNCTKMSSDEIANEGEEEGQDGEGNEFQKATKGRAPYRESNLRTIVFGNPKQYAL